MPGQAGQVDRLALLHRTSDGKSLAVSSYRAAAARFIEASAVGDLDRKNSASGERPGLAAPASTGTATAEQRAWKRTVIAIDGHPVAFRLLAEGNNWVAFARVDDVYVKIDSSGFPLDDVTLAHITDTQPYLTSTAGVPR